jgi:ABC-2 type transport system permease protein
MTPMLLVAGREFRQILATRSFWITLLILPLALVATQVATRFIAKPVGVAYVLVDAGGRYAPAIEARLRGDRDRQVLGELSAYAARWDIRPSGGAVWAGGRRGFGDAEIAGFEAAGGLQAAQAQLARLKPKAAPDFHPSPPEFIGLPPPPDVVTTQGPERFGATLAPHLRGQVATSAGARPLALGVYVPADLGAPGAAIRIWTNGRANADLIDAIRSAASEVMRAEALRRSGVDLAALARAEGVTAPVSVAAPPGGSGPDRVALRSAVPLAIAYVLMIAIVISGAWLLQSLLEERSNKLLEAVLACVTPDDLLFGKLLGVLGVTTVMVAAWIGAAAVAALAFHGVIARAIGPSTELLRTPWIPVAILYFFLAGYLCMAMLYLAVGSVSENMRDAQGYLSPMIFAITLPFVLVVNAVLRNPDGLLPRVLSWIPFYSPFAMLARLGSGVSPWEVAGSGLVLGAFVALEMVVIGRLFRANLLQAGQGLKLRDLPKLLRARAV